MLIMFSVMKTKLRSLEKNMQVNSKPQKTWQLQLLDGRRLTQKDKEQLSLLKERTRSLLLKLTILRMEKQIKRSQLNKLISHLLKKNKLQTAMELGILSLEDSFLRLFKTKILILLLEQVFTLAHRLSKDQVALSQIRTSLLIDNDRSVLIRKIFICFKLFIYLI